jgi:uncharacterized protein YbcI
MEGPEAPNPAAAAIDSKRATIQREIVKLHKEFFGRGPVRTKLYLQEDCALVLMFEGHMPGERTLLEHGGRRSVAQTRVDMSESMRERFIELVERETGREVVGFMSSSQQDPDLLSHVYVLKPTDLLSSVPDEHSEA